MSKILVTGGSGFVGAHLLPRLIAAGHSAVVLVRGSHRAALPQPAKIVLGDVVTGTGLDEALRGVDAVIHLVAVIRERGPYTYQSVNVGGTANLVQAMRRAGVQRLIHMSALGASPDPRFRYTHSKWQGEQVVRESNLRYTILRPSLLAGPGGFLEKLHQSIAPVPLFAPVPGSGRTRFQPVWIEDVVTCVLLALERPDYIGETYEIGGPEYLTYDDILDLLLRRLCLRRLKLHIPLRLMTPLVNLMARVLPDPPVTPAELAQLELDNTTTLDSVVTQFGFPPAHLAGKLDWLAGERE